MDTKRIELCERLDKALLKIQRIAVRPEVLEFVNPETYSGPSMAEVMACSFIADFDHSGDLSVKDIAAAIGLDHSTVSRLALNLERDGLIVRSQSQSDRRKTTISLTEAGQLVADNANQFRSWIISQLLTDWSDLEISELTNSLNRILQTTSEKLPDLIKQAHTKFDQNS
ncbi:MAG: hypothetical protein RJA41_154 [Actinomycetota bacterium]